MLTDYEVWLEEKFITEQEDDSWIREYYVNHAECTVTVTAMGSQTRPDSDAPNKPSLACESSKTSDHFCSKTKYSRTDLPQGLRCSAATGSSSKNILIMCTSLHSKWLR